MIKFSDKFRQLREERGKTLQDMYDVTAVNNRTLYMSTNPRKTTIAALAYFLGMRAEDMVAGTDWEEAWYN